MPPTHCLGCCSNCGNSGWGQQPAAPAPQTAPAPVPALRVTSSLSLDEAGPKKQLLPNASTAVWGCCSGPRDRHPEFTPSAPQRRAFHPHILCVTVACDTGTALPPARPPPCRAQAGFPRAALPAWDGYVGAKLEQGCSQAVQSHPKQIWSALKVPSCHPWQMLHRHPELCDRHQHAPLEAQTLGSYTAPGKTHLGSWGRERRYPSNCTLIT